MFIWSFKENTQHTPSATLVLLFQLPLELVNTYKDITPDYFENLLCLQDFTLKKHSML